MCGSVHLSPTSRLYDDLTWLWPILSDPTHYRGEAASFRDAIRGHATIPSRSLLDLGCGGGHNDLHLKQDFQVTGVDLSAGILDHARRLNPEATYTQDDLRTVRLGTSHDAVIIADAIDYVCRRQPGSRLSRRISMKKTCRRFPCSSAPCGHDMRGSPMIKPANAARLTVRRCRPDDADNLYEHL